MREAGGGELDRAEGSILSKSFSEDHNIEICPQVLVIEEHVKLEGHKKDSQQCFEGAFPSWVHMC